MANEIKIVGGKWHVQGPKISEVADGQTYFTIASNSPERRVNTYTVPGFYYPDSTLTPEEMQAHADLFAEAGTVTNESGLTPRELLTKCQETSFEWLKEKKRADELEKENAELLEQNNVLKTQAKFNESRLSTLLEQRKELLEALELLHRNCKFTETLSSNASQSKINARSIIQKYEAKGKQ